MLTWYWNWPVRPKVDFPQIVLSARLLEKQRNSWEQLLLQDMERQEDGPARKDGASRYRVPPAHDPEMRHGRKSSSKRFDGHKAAVVVAADSQLVTGGRHSARQCR